MGDKFGFVTKQINDLQISDIEGNNKVDLPKVLTKDKMPVSREHIPRNSDLVSWEHMEGVDLKEINSNVRLFLGNNVHDVLTPIETRRDPKGSPLIIKSPLGWIAYSVVRTYGHKDYFVNRASVVLMEDVNELEKLENLYRESVNLDFPEKTVDGKLEHSQEDKLFLSKVDKSMRLVYGHYEMALQFTDENVYLPNDLRLAEQRLKYLKRKIEGDMVGSVLG